MAVKLGGKGDDLEVPIGVSPSGGHIDQGDDGETCGGREVVISPVGGSSRSSRLAPHTGVHLETPGNHRGTSDMPTHL